MSDIRLFITTTEKTAGAILDLMSEAFEEDGYAIATMEVDEKRDVWEASLYIDFDEEAEMTDRFAALVGDAYPELAINREVIPDVDWIARSLEGLQPVHAGRFVVHGSHDRGKARAGEIRNFTGIDSPYERPEAAELVLDTTAATAEALAEVVVGRLLED